MYHSRRVSRRLDVLSKLQENNLEQYYEVGSLLGSGKFAVVKQCTNRQTGRVYAGKFIKRRRSRKNCLVNEIEAEISILQGLDHENIIKLFEVFECPLEVVLMLELVSGGELFHYLIERERVTEEEGVHFILQVLRAVQYMHTCSVVHLDLKPENLVLINKVDRKLKVIDFGLSVKLVDGSICREITGTPEFVAPEVINFDPVTPAADMWSVGVITFIMLSGCSPFLGEDKQTTLSNVTKGEFEFDESFKRTSHLAKEFIHSLLILNPRERATADDSLKHPWLNPRDMNEMANRRKSRLNITNLKSFMAKKRWKQSFHAISLFNHLSNKVKFNKTGLSSSSLSSSSLSSSLPTKASLLQPPLSSEPSSSSPPPSSSSSSLLQPPSSSSSSSLTPLQSNLLRVKKKIPTNSVTTKQLHTTTEGKIRLSVVSGYDSE